MDGSRQPARTGRPAGVVVVVGGGGGGGVVGVVVVVVVVVGGGGGGGGGGFGRGSDGSGGGSDDRGGAFVAWCRCKACRYVCDSCVHACQRMASSVSEPRRSVPLCHATHCPIATRPNPATRGGGDTNQSPLPEPLPLAHSLAVGRQIVSPQTTTASAKDLALSRTWPGSTLSQNSRSPPKRLTFS